MFGLMRFLLLLRVADRMPWPYFAEHRPIRCSLCWKQIKNEILSRHLFGPFDWARALVLQRTPRPQITADPKQSLEP